MYLQLTLTLFTLPRTNSKYSATDAQTEKHWKRVFWKMRKGLNSLQLSQMLNIHTIIEILFFYLSWKSCEMSWGQSLPILWRIISLVRSVPLFTDFIFSTKNHLLLSVLFFLKTMLSVAFRIHIKAPTKNIKNH